MQAPGSWTEFNFTIPEADLAVFKEATHGIIGVHYVPVAVSTQVVAGTNYCFLSKATPVYPGASTYLVLVYIFKPLQGAAHVTQITRVGP